MISNNLKIFENQKLTQKKKNFSRLDVFSHKILRLNNIQVKLHNQMELVKSKIDLFVAGININKNFISLTP
jgi:hypothetical protein